MIKERQTNFLGGELAPTVHGRADLPQYGAGAKTLLNFTPTPHGALVNRMGMMDLLGTEIRLYGSTPMRIVPFIFDRSFVRLLIFCDERLLIFSPTAFAEGGTFLTQFDSPYSEAHLSTLKFSQIGLDVIIVSPNYAPYKLRNPQDGTGNWEFSEISFDVPEYLNVRPVVMSNRSGHEFEGDSSHDARPWEWVVTQVVRRDDGTVYESAPQTVPGYADDPAGAGDPYVEQHLYPALPETIALFPDWDQRLYLYLDALATVDGTIITKRIYRGRDGYFGFVGESKTEFFADDGSTPDFSNPPPQEFNPFDLDEDGEVDANERPSVVTHHENRRLYASTPARPENIWGSALGDFDNHDEVPIPDDSDAYSFRMAANFPQKVTALVPGPALICLTSAAEWLIAGSGDGSPITPNAIAPRPFSYVGSTDAVDVVLAGSAIMFLSRNGVRPYAIILDGQGARSIDTSIISSHLFDGQTIVDWAYASDPHRVVWAVRDDGVLLSCTVIPEQGVFAWARHEIAGDGRVESIAVLPDGVEDRLYAIVVHERESGGDYRYLERFALRAVENERDRVYLDRSRTYDGNAYTGHGMEDTIVFTDPGEYGGDVGDSIIITFSNGSNLAVGDLIHIYDPDGGLPFQFRLDIDNGGGEYESTVMTRDVEDFIWDEDGIAKEDWYIPTNSVTDLHHLEGQTVCAVADGDVIPDLVVNGGEVALDSVYAATIHVGLPYDCDFESLDAAGERGRLKIVKSVIVEMLGGRGAVVGQSFDNEAELHEVEIRDVTDNYDPISERRTETRVPVSSNYSESGRVVLRHGQPTAITVLGITREVEYGG